MDKGALKKPGNNKGKHWVLSAESRNNIRLGVLKRKKRNGYINSPETRKKISKALTGLVRSEETKKKIGLAKRKNPSRHWLGKKRPNLHSQEVREKISRSLKGEKSPFWISDRTKLKKDRKKSYDTQYKYWMLSVKKRDGWKCKISSHQCSGRLEAHHILPWSQFPELRYEVNNGITLCRFHHPRKMEDVNKLSQFFQGLVAEMN